MIKSEKFYVRSDAMKLDNGKTALDVFEVVKSVVRHKELEVTIEKKVIRDAKEIYGAAHPGKDVMTASEEDCRIALGVDFGEFWKARKEVEALAEECDNCLSMDLYTALPATDKIHVTLIAHTIYNRVVLDNSIFKYENGGVSLSDAISEYYANGSKKNMKEILKPIFHKLLGSEGEYFYGIKVRNSNFKEEDIRQFLAVFGGVPKREIKGSDKKGYSYGAYIWVDKSKDLKLQARALTDLMAVILDNSDRHEVVKPEKTESEYTVAGAKTVAEVEAEQKKSEKKSAKKSEKKSGKKSEKPVEKAEEKKENK